MRALIEAHRGAEVYEAADEALKKAPETRGAYATPHLGYRLPAARNRSTAGSITAPTEVTKWRPFLLWALVASLNPSSKARFRASMKPRASVLDENSRRNPPGSMPGPPMIITTLVDAIVTSPKILNCLMAPNSVLPLLAPSSGILASQVPHAPCRSAQRA